MFSIPCCIHFILNLKVKRCDLFYFSLSWRQWFNYLDEYSVVDEMGIDINFIIEEKVGEDEWKYIEKDSPDFRCRLLFSLLADGRGIVKPLVPLRGFPNTNDENTLKQQQYFSGENHFGKTWYMLDELKSLLDELGPLQEAYEQFDGRSNARNLSQERKEYIEEEFRDISHQRAIYYDNYGNGVAFNMVNEDMVDFDEEALVDYIPCNYFASFYKRMEKWKKLSENPIRVTIVFDS
jgi:hypothetical protein